MYVLSETFHHFHAHHLSWITVVITKQETPSFGITTFISIIHRPLIAIISVGHFCFP